MSLLTIFTAPKPFVDPHINTIQRNALRSWKLLGSDVDVILYGNDPGVAEAAAEFGMTHVPDVASNEKGVPYIDDMFRRTRALSDAPVLAVVNSDIILFPDFVETARHAHSKVKDFVLVGRRWDLDITEELAFGEETETWLKAEAEARNSLKGPTASDYFIFSRSVLTEIPNFTIGRAGWDSWMIYHSLQQPWQILDTTSEIFIVHQNHDYGHLPDGEPHYKLPESKRNVALGGGEQNMYDQTDLRMAMVAGKVVRKPFSWYRTVRLLEHRLHPEGEPKGFRGKIFRIVKRYRRRMKKSRDAGKPALLK
jgi:hypothetical protein